MSDNDPNNPFKLSGKVAVVTGGVGIIGNRVCRGLAAAGADVAVIDLDADAAAALAGDLAKDHGVRAMGVACDVSDPQAVVAMVARVTDELGGIHVLHNNAQSRTRDPKAEYAPFEVFDLGTWRHIMGVNVDGVFLVAQAVGRQMVAQGTGGSIIQTGSIYGLVGPDFAIYEGSEYQGQPITTPAAYAASKGAVAALTRYLAAYWGDKDIRVNTLVPGGVESGQNETFVGNYSGRVPMGRMARADDMVGAVVYLASDASRYVTGQMVIVDGGWTMR